MQCREKWVCGVVCNCLNMAMDRSADSSSLESALHAYLNRKMYKFCMFRHCRSWLWGYFVDQTLPSVDHNHLPVENAASICLLEISPAIIRSAVCIHIMQLFVIIHYAVSVLCSTLLSDAIVWLLSASVSYSTDTEAVTSYIMEWKLFSCIKA